MSTFPRSQAEELRRLPCLKYYYNVLKKESRYNLELWAVKITDYLYPKMVQTKIDIIGIISSIEFSSE